MGWRLSASHSVVLAGDVTTERGALATLNYASYLDARYTNHRISVPELEWMAENWPSLCCIRELFKNGRGLDHAVVAWLKVNKPDWAFHTGL